MTRKIILHNYYPKRRVRDAVNPNQMATTAEKKYVVTARFTMGTEYRKIFTDLAQARAKFNSLKADAQSTEVTINTTDASSEETKAMKEGYEAGRRGKTKSDNPYKSTGGGSFNAGILNKMAWTTGFERGQADR